MLTPLVFTGSITFDRMFAVNNVANFAGAAVAVSLRVSQSATPSVTISNSTFVGNSASVKGGAVFLEHLRGPDAVTPGPNETQPVTPAPMVVIDCVFVDNVVLGFAGQQEPSAGGALLYSQVPHRCAHTVDPHTCICTVVSCVTLVIAHVMVCRQSIRPQEHPTCCPRVSQCNAVLSLAMPL